MGTAMLGGLLITTAATANAEVVKLQADLKGNNEVQLDRFGKGRGNLRHRDENPDLHGHLCRSVRSRMGPHFHGLGEAGKNAGIALPFKTAQSPIQGTATLTEYQASDLLAGKWYANIHAALNAGGELRGQMMK